MRDYDLVIYVDQWAALTGVLNRLLHGTPFILFLHEFFRRPPSGVLYPLLMLPAILWDRFAIACADVVVTTSEYNYREVSARRTRVFLARLGCKEAEQLAVRKKNQVLSLTLWDRGRNPWIYLDIAKSLPNVSFVLAGGWTEAAFREEVRSAARGLSNVLITGPISDAEKERLLEESLVYLRFGYEERGPGLGGLEALGHGCLVITNRDLGLSEILVNRVDGFILDTPDPIAAAALIGEIIEYDPERIASMQSAAAVLCRSMSWLAHGRVLMRAVRAAVRLN
jgi:glycosyltransferase involved in cell wall biosynthesis